MKSVSQKMTPISKNKEILSELSTLIIKKGEHGAMLFQEGKMFYAPALPLEEVFDPTGAGDTFAGGFIGYLAASDDTSWEAMKRAIVIGSALASFTVEKFGIERLLEISFKDIQKRVEELSNLTACSFEGIFEGQQAI